MDGILYWNRSTQRVEREEVLDDRILRLLYGTRPGRLATALFFSSRLFSLIYALGSRSRGSAWRIAPFVERFGIRVDEFEPRAYRSFDDFFTRRFRPGARRFSADPRVLPAFAQGRYLAWPAARADRTLPVKGAHLSTRALLGSQELAAAFDGGPVLLARLAPQDYHRFHFVDSGPVTGFSRIRGSLHSVNPLALAAKPDILAVNRRDVTIQQTRSFGRLAYIEIGAMTVGRIIQNPRFAFRADDRRVTTRDDPCGGGDRRLPRRGDEKGRFELGGSTVVLLGEPGAWVPDPEIAGRTREGMETLVELGSPVGRSPGPG